MFSIPCITIMHGMENVKSIAHFSDSLHVLHRYVQHSVSLIVMCTSYVSKFLRGFDSLIEFYITSLSTR